jgi:hypothetical protein
MSYEYSVIGIRQRQERLQQEAESERLAKMIRQQHQAGHRMGTVLVKTGILLITAGKRLQHQDMSEQPALTSRRTGRGLSLNTHYEP